MRVPTLSFAIMFSIGAVAFAAATVPASSNAQGAAPAADAANPDAAQAVSRAEAAVADLGRSLREALMAEMAGKGPVASIDFCHEQAPLIAEAVSQRHGVNIGRMGVRVRNPDNAPEGWRRDVLDAFAARAAAGEAPQTLQHTQIDTAQGLVRYARGIGTEPACQVCHGASVAEPVRAAIQARYPADAATGFEAGSLRGAFWVEAPLSMPAALPADHRVAIPLSSLHQAELREEMRGQLMTVQGIVGALAAKDWTAVATLADARGPGSGRAAAGKGFRTQLPAEWFELSRPMHVDYAALADEARNGKRIEIALGHLESATSKCTACHATYRTEQTSRR